MRCRRSFLKQQRAYPDLTREWLANGRRKLAGLPLKPLPDVKQLKTGRPETQVIVLRGAVEEGKSEGA